MRTGFRYTCIFLGIFYVYALMWRFQDISGTYISSTDASVVMLDIREQPRGVLTGNYQSATLMPDGKLRYETYSVGGTAMSWVLDLTYRDGSGRVLQRPIKGEHHGNQVTLNYGVDNVDRYSQVLNRNQRSTFFAELDHLQEEAAAFQVSSNDTETAKK